MPTTPSWSAAVNGLPSELDSTELAAQVGQELGTHSVSILYDGTRILTPSGGTQYTYYTPGNVTDISQPFVLSGTNVGRVVIPVQYNDNAADLHVTLCPDNGGVPLTTNPIVSTNMPAIMIRNMIAELGLENATTALQTATSNTQYCTGGITQLPWASPLGDASGVANNAAVVVDGNYFIFLGGFTTVAVGTVASAEFQGGTTLALPVTQPPLPTPNYYVMGATTTNAIVACGGYNGTSPSSAVFTASWDVNTGTIGAWSGQAAMPITRWGAGVASFNDTVYIVGGTQTGASALSSFIYANVDNGQITGWNTGPDLPQATMSPMLTVCNGWLICAGGCTISASPFNNVWMAKIYSDGTIGGWIPGPNLQTAVFSYAPGWDIATTDNEVIVMTGFTGASTFTDAVQVLPVTANTFGTWRQFRWNQQFRHVAGAFDNGDGSWQLINPIVVDSDYRVSTLGPVGLLSVPLAASGLTNGATYHVVIQQHQSQTGSDFLSIGVLDDTPLPLPALGRARYVGTWGNLIGSGFSVPMSVYNQDVSASGDVRHTLEDLSSTGSVISTNIAAASSTHVWDYLHQLIGRVSVVNQPNIALNRNPTFTTGVANWTTTRCTLTQSNAQTHGGFPFSGLITPDGTGTAIIESDKVFLPVSSNQVLASVRWFTVNSWFNSPNGYTGLLFGIRWYDSGNNLIQTSTVSNTISAATWTNFATFSLAPNSASYGSIFIDLSGTPAVTDTLFVSNAVFVLSNETVDSFASVVTVDYDPTTLLPMSTTELT